MLLMGCAPRIAVHDYPLLGLRIIQADRTTVHRKCGYDESGIQNEACAFVPQDNNECIKPTAERPCEIWEYDPQWHTHEVCHCNCGEESKCQQENW